jgi:hypothetical protein
MSDGQLALNTNLASPGLFFKDSNGDSIKVGPVHVGTTAPNATPGVGGQAGNSKGEQWLDTSSSRYVFKIWDGTAWRTEDGEFVNASGDTMTGALVMDNQQQVRFRETTANGTNFIAVQAPAAVAADRTLTLPDVTGTIVSTGDTGTVTSTMILDGTILNADINASAAIVDTKLATIATAGKVSNSATTATSALGASTIVARDASNNFSAGTITANLTGTASNVTTNANLTGHITSVGNAAVLGSFTSAQLAAALTNETGSGAAVFATSPTLVTPLLGTPTSGNLANCTFPTLNQSTTGNAATATTLATARTINGVSFNGSANIDVPDLRAANSTVLIDGTGVTSAVNYVSLTNAAATGTVVLSTAGTDVNIPLRVTTKGAGSLELSTSGGPVLLRPGTSNLRLYDDTNAFYHNFVTGTMVGNRTLTFPDANVTLVGGTMVASGGALGTPSSGTLTNCTFPTLNQSTTGNAATATNLSSVRTFALTGDVTGSVSSNLSAGASIAATIAAGVIVNADINASAAIVDTKLATIATAGKVSNSATTATSTNTASAIVARDGSGNFSAGTITAALTGTASGNARLVQGTAVSTTSGTSVDFTSIPSWVKRITVTLAQVSTNGASIPLIQLGDSGGVETTGYFSLGASISVGTDNTTRGGSSTDGIRLASNVHTAASELSGNIEIINISGNTWVASGVFIGILDDNADITIARKTLSATLDRIRLTTTGGVNTFDAGTMNILYEG